MPYKAIYRTLLTFKQSYTSKVKQYHIYKVRVENTYIIMIISISNFCSQQANRLWYIFHSKLSLMKIPLLMLSYTFLGVTFCLVKHLDISKVRKNAKLRYRYNQIPQNALNTIWESNKNKRNITHKKAEMPSLYPSR